MKFEKRNFMGIELDVLVGHPEHDLLFVATQVAQAAGLKRASKSVSKYILARRPGELAFKLEDIVKCHPKVDIKIPKTAQFRRWPDVWIATEATTYQMLLRGHAPQSEPFRKWITEEVLPSIRKTGKYSAEDSTNPIAVAIMDELKSLRGEIVSLRQELQAKTFSLAAPVVPEVSPYEGQAAVALCDPLGFNKRLYRELAESCLDRPTADIDHLPLRYWRQRMITVYQGPRDIAQKLFREAGRTWNSSSTVEMADHLFNFCVTHVALRDWVMTTLGVPREDNNFHSVWRAKADGLFGECADIANLSKHLKISKPTGDITAIREDLVAIGMDGEVVKGSAQARDSYQLVRPSGECLDLVTLFHRVCMAWDECFLSDTRLGEPLPSYVEAFVRWQ